MADAADGREARRWPPLGHVVLAGGALWVLWATLGVLAAARSMLFLAFLGVLLAAILNYPVSYLARRMPRPLAAFLVLLGVLGVLVGLAALAVPIVAEQGSRLVERAPQAADRLQQWWDWALRRAPISRGTTEQIAASAKERLGAALAAVVGRSVPLLLGAVTTLTGIILLIVLAIFLAYEPRTYMAGILRLVPSRHEAVAAELMTRIGRTLTGWMIGTLAGMLIVGGATALGLLLVGVESWLVLGILMFFGEFVPYVGPIAGAIPGVAIGLAQSPMTGLWALLVYVAVQQLEGHLVMPLVMRRAVSLPPALLLVWQLLVAKAFGLLAMLVSTPLLACIKVAVEVLYVERTLGKK